MALFNLVVRFDGVGVGLEYLGLSITGNLMTLLNITILLANRFFESGLKEGDFILFLKCSQSPGFEHRLLMII